MARKRGGAPRPGAGAALRRDLEAAFADLAALRERNPFGNSVKLLALDIGKRLDRNVIGLGAIAGLIQDISVEAFARRGRRLAGYLGETDPARNDERLRRLFRRLAKARSGDAPLLPFADFKALVEREWFGIVLTAHPTFGMPREMATALAGLAVEKRPRRRQRLLALARSSEHRPPVGIDLAYEHDFSILALKGVHAALRRVYDLLLETAAELYPADWRLLSPRLITLASWVGYDLDGRTDIKWSDSLLKRLKLQQEQLAHYLESSAALRRRAGPRSRKILAALSARLRAAMAEARAEIAVFAEAPSPGRAETLRRRARAMHRGRASRLIDAAQLLGLVEQALALTRDGTMARRLLILRAELANHGLGLAHTHVRLNAVQIHNAVRKLIGMESAPDDPANKRSYLAAMAAKLAAVRPLSVNFASILAERTSAKRLFMIVAQMLKYVDRSAPVRFLIAETETPLTLLAALYLARLFGVEDRLDLSPLFETTKAFERGVRVIDDCLQNPDFAAYVRRRGRLCVQTGFSDAGRHLGQTVAAISIEWLRLKLADLLVARGFASIELVIFDTHGEAIGRGGHPEDFRRRLDYIASPASRFHFRRLGLRVKEEASFQGGDGYLYFLAPETAFAALTRILETVLPPPPDALSADPLYVAEEDYTKEFFITVRLFNERVMEDADYAALLDMFGGHLLFQSGSRPLRRESEGAAMRQQLAHPRAMRAIPHNGILQQLGFLANTLGGIGQAINKDPERFQRMFAASPRFRLLLSQVEWALAFSDLEALKCYIDLYDPGQWLSRAAQESRPARAKELRHVAEHLEAEAAYEKLARIYRRFQRDFIDLRDGLRLIGGGRPKIDEATRRSLRLMHASRIALLMRVFMLTAHIPDFSPQHGITRQQLIAKIFHLEIDAALRQLEIIFPKTETAPIRGDFGERATYVDDGNQSYEREHRLIFQPIADLYRLALRLSSALNHTIGALG